MDFETLDDAVKFMVDNGSEFSNWSILRDDIGMVVYAPTGKTAAFVYLNSENVVYPSWDWTKQ